MRASFLPSGKSTARNNRVRETDRYTRSDIFAELAQMGAPRDRVVLMHSSLRLIGEVEGGACGLLDVMRRLYALCPFDPLADETPGLPRYYAK